MSRTFDASSSVRGQLQDLGVLLPIRLHPLTFLPGRHPLGRPGGGMRFLRTRPYEPGEDSPRDIDKFSSPDAPRVNEWEAEVRASILLLGDVSASMADPLKSSLRNTVMLQLLYSLWRAGDRVKVGLFGPHMLKIIAEPNLKTQFEAVLHALGNAPRPMGTEIVGTLIEHLRGQRKHENLIFVISDFSPVVENDQPGPSAPARPLTAPDLRSARNIIIPVVTTFQLPLGLAGLVKVRDAERGEVRLIQFSRKRISQINKAERRRVEELERDFRDLGCDYLILKDARSAYPQLARLARIRRRRNLR